MRGDAPSAGAAAAVAARLSRLADRGASPASAASAIAAAALPVDARRSSMRALGVSAAAAPIAAAPSSPEGLTRSSPVRYLVAERRRLSVRCALTAARLSASVGARPPRATASASAPPPPALRSSHTAGARRRCARNPTGSPLNRRARRSHHGIGAKGSFRCQFGSLKRRRSGIFGSQRRDQGAGRFVWRSSRATATFAGSVMEIISATATAVCATLPSSGNWRHWYRSKPVPGTFRKLSWSSPQSPTNPRQGTFGSGLHSRMFTRISWQLRERRGEASP